ncbi:MAG: hypothetical protein IKC01_01245 [Clostridia bacterium]|nr:hypothetical protein [Clostridia bacterium]
MKKLLAVLLAVMIAASIMPSAFAVTTPGLATRVIEGTYNEKALEVTSVTQDTFTVVVKCPAVTKLVGLNMFLDFDSETVKVLEAGPVGAKDADGNFVPNFNGEWAHGLKANKYQYSFGFISTSGVTKKAAKDLVYITFQIFDSTQPTSTINLYINEFLTEDGNDDNEVIATVLVESQIVTLNLPEAITKNPNAETTTDTPADAESTNALIQLIRDLLAGNGVTFEDYADAILNLIGNAEITDMIEQLVDGAFSIEDAFIEILKGLGLDFDSLEDILNAIIDFFKDLFDGDEDGDETTGSASNPTTQSSSEAVLTTNAASATTSAGSTSGSEGTGDAGVALAATVCVAAAATFVLTRKKREE